MKLPLRRTGWFATGAVLIALCAPFAVSTTHAQSLGGLYISNGNYRVCWAAASAADDVSPFDLIWEVDDGTTSAAPGEDTSFAVTFSPDQDSPCITNATIEVLDPSSHAVAFFQDVIEPDRSLVEFTWPANTDQAAGPVIVRANGTASGCTATELATFSILQSTFTDEGAPICGGSSLLTEERYAVTFRRQGFAGRYRVFDAQCAAANAADDVSPFDLIWDVADGITSSTAQSRSELIVYVSPRILQVCPHASVALDAVFEDSTGQEASVSTVLDAHTPSFVGGGSTGRATGVASASPLPVDRVFQRYSAQARSSGCKRKFRPTDLVVYLNQLDRDTGVTLERQRLGGVVRWGGGGW